MGGRRDGKIAREVKLMMIEQKGRQLADGLSQGRPR